jgi:putative ABC transport system substrate-binding protein
MQFQMKRRKFITLLGGAAAWPLAAHAQQRERMRRIGVLVNGPETDAELAARIVAFRKALPDLGWVPGKNLQIDARFGANDDDLLEKAKELVGLAPDVILAMAPPSVIALQKISRTIPVVFAAVTDPVGLGIVRSLAHPGGNATGFFSAEFGFGAKLLGLLKETRARHPKGDCCNRLGQPQCCAAVRRHSSDGVLSWRGTASAQRVG